MHTFTSNSSVTINAVTQDTGVIEGEVYTAQVGDTYEGKIHIEVIFKKDDEVGTPVHHSTYQPTEAEMETFEGTVTLTATTVVGRFEELVSRYVLAEVDGMWGLTSADWTLNAH